MRASPSFQTAILVYRFFCVWKYEKRKKSLKKISEICDLLDLINLARTGKKLSRSGIARPGPHLATGLTKGSLFCEIDAEIWILQINLGWTMQQRNLLRDLSTRFKFPKILRSCSGHLKTCKCMKNQKMMIFIQTVFYLHKGK